MTDDGIELIEVDLSETYAGYGLEPGELIYEFCTESFTCSDVAHSAMLSRLNAPIPIEIKVSRRERSFHMVVATIQVVYLEVEEKEREEIGSDYFLEPEYLLTGWLFNPLQPVFDPGQKPNVRCYLKTANGKLDGGLFQKIPEKPGGKFQSA